MSPEPAPKREGNEGVGEPHGMRPANQESRTAHGASTRRAGGGTNAALRGGFLLLVLSNVLFVGCRESGAGDGASVTPNQGAQAWKVADGAERPVDRLAVALYGGRDRGVIGVTEEEELAAQEPEGYALRGRAPGEGHEAPAGSGGEVLAEVEVRSDPSEPATRRAAAPAGKDNQLPDGTPGKDDEEDEGEDEQEKDYWSGVDFTRDHFDEVRRFVKLHYIEDVVDEKRAYIEASNFALLSLGEQPLEILPESFYELRKGHPDEEGRLDGETFKLGKGDRFILHAIQKDKKDKPRRRLSDDEIRQLRLREKARYALLERHWDDVPFSEADFTTLMGEASKRLAKNPEVRASDLWIAAAQGYLYSLDPHSSLVSAKAWDESTRQTEDASFDGIGAVLTQRDDETIVESPIEGQPAVTAGLHAGDVIIKVDDKEVGGVPLFKVVKRIRGPRGTPVKLTVRRLGLPEDLEITITRAHIDIKNVSGRLLDAPYEDFGYIKMSGFVRTSAEKFDEMVAELARQTKSGRLRGLVFDLRNDNGGLLSQGIAVADRFLTRGDIVSVRNKPSALPGMGGRDEVYQATPSRTVDVPVVVLVNDGTASAAEIVASALQENRRALVVGERTFGKASVQTLYPPPGQKDYYIKLTVARYYSPTGRTIQLTGVQPDVEVPPEIGGEMPLGFREENLRNPLPPENAHYRSPMATMLPALDQCVAERGKAEALHAADPNPAIKFDYQLIKGTDYLECLISLGDRASTHNTQN